jgi:PAS domain S-box-containing protein
MTPSATETPDPAVALPLAGVPIAPRLDELFESMSDAFVAYDAEWRLVQMNRAARAWLASAGTDADLALGRVVWEVLPEMEHTEFGRRLRGAMEQRAAVRFDSPGPRSRRWAEIVAFPTPEGLAVLARDITERKRAEWTREFVTRAGRVLGDAALEVDDTLAALTALAVPDLADWCFVDQAEEDGGFRRMAVAHADPAHADLARRLTRRYGPKPGAPAVTAALEGARPVLIVAADDAARIAVARDEDHLAMLRELGLHSSIVVPLASRERLLGALSLCRSATGEPYGPADLEVAEELARRAAMALERARLYDAERAARRRADAVLESIGDGFASFDDEWRFRYVNARAAEMAGTTREAVLGRVLWDVVGDVAETPLMAAMRRVMQGRTAEELESVSTVLGGRWLDARVYPAEDGGVSVFFRDATEAHRARAALRESESRLAAALDVASLGVWTVDLATNEVTVSGRLREMLGISVGDPRPDGELVPAAIHPDDLAAARAALASALERVRATGAGVQLRTECRVLHPDGGTRWIAPIGQVLCAADGTPTLAVGVARDVTGRVLAEAERLELFSRERELRLAAERSAERTARLQRITALLAAALPTDEVASLFAGQVREAFGADTAWLAVLSPDGREFRALADIGAPEGPHRWLRFAAEAPVPAAEVVRDGRPRVYASKAELREAFPVLGPSLETPPQEALVCLPLEVGTGTFGVITFGFHRPRRFGADDVEFASALARQCAQALERARLYDAERAARAEAEAANRAKSEFLATMSHELRTPLNAIGGYAELMEMGLYGELTPEQHDVVARVQRSQRHLLSLINDVLNFARIEAGHVELSVRRVECDGLLAGLEALVAPQIAAKGLVFRSAPAVEGLAVAADEERLRQVLLNLLSNAIKFTPAGGGITVTAEAEEARVHVRVRDTGVGIAPEHLERVFDAFVQVGRTLSAPHDGVGLGLAISRDLARAMGGDLHAESTPGAGSTFTLVLPAA